jgi:predicted PurR-regulated permease PerM
VIAGLLLGTAALSLGQALLVPLALASLLAFLLAPASSRLERLGLRRTPAVIAVCLAIGLLMGGVGWIATRELASLVAEAPRYRENLREKIASLRGPLGSMDRAADAVSALEAELDEPTPGQRREVAAPKVEVVERLPLLDRLGSIVSPIADLLASTAIVVVLAVFMLLQREDLRDRVIRLVGSRDLTLTTTALDDAGGRISRYLGMQALLCGVHGLMVGAGLWLFGIPGALFWGAVAGLFRFVPYFGPWIAAILPIATAAGALDGWTPALLCAGYFIVLELISNNVLEPWLYGSSVGLSPFAIVVSAVFWSWLWGIPGLLLATPLSACLVVLGRYVRGLGFVAILLSDEPPLQPGVRFYQRVLARKRGEAEAILASVAETEPDGVADRVILPALQRLSLDAAVGALDPLQAEQTLAEFEDLLGAQRLPTATSDLEQITASAPLRVVCMAALDAADELASRWLAGELTARGVPSVAIASELLVAEQLALVLAAHAELVCISALTPAASARAQQLAKRLLATGKAPEIAIGAWSSTTPSGTAPMRLSSQSAARWLTSGSELFAAVS